MAAAEVERLKVVAAKGKGPVRLALLSAAPRGDDFREVGTDAPFAVVPSAPRAVGRRAAGSKKLEPIAQTPFEIHDVAVLADRWLVAGGRDGTHVFDVTDLARGAVDVLPGTGGRVHPEPALGAILGGRMLWLRPSTHRSTSFYVPSEGKLRRVATLDVPLAILERDGAILAHALFAWVRLEGLEALVAAEPVVKKKASTSKSSKLELHPAPADRPQPATLAAATRKRLGRDATWYRILDDGRAIVFDGEKTGDIAWLDADGGAHTMKAPELPRTLDLSDDGLVLVALSHRLLLCDAKGKGTPKEVTVPAKLGDVRAGFFCHGGRVVLLTSKGLHVLTRSGAVKGSAPITQPSYMLTIAGGAWVAVTSHAKTGLIVFDLTGAKPVARLRAPLAVVDLHAVGSRFFARASTGAWFEVTGLTP